MSNVKFPLKKRKTGRTFDRSEIPNSGCPRRYRYHAHAACSRGRRPVRLWTWQKFGQFFGHEKKWLGEAILESWNQGAEWRLIFPKLKFHGCQDLNPKVQRRWKQIGHLSYEVWLVPNLRLVLNSHSLTERLFDSHNSFPLFCFPILSPPKTIISHSLFCYPRDLCGPLFWDEPVSDPDCETETFRPPRLQQDRDQEKPPTK